MSGPAPETSGAQITLARDPASSRSARQFVRRFIADHRVDCEADVVALLVSEMVTNAVLHARGEITVHVAALPRALRVEVHDTSGKLPRQRRHGDDAATGRGLELVSTFASDWGARPLHRGGGQGKVVWFEVPARPGTATTPAARRHR